MSIILSRVPSELIRISLEDLRKVESDDRYVISMTNFHCHDSQGICMVCLAGAVMAKTLNVSIDALAAPASFPENERQLIAIDALRLGCVSSAFKTLEIEDEALTLFRYRNVTPYEDNPEIFFWDMHELADWLQIVGH